MKTFIIALGGALALLHLGLAFAGPVASPFPIHLGTALAGAAIVLLGVFLKPGASAESVARTPVLAPSVAPAAPLPTVPPAAAIPPSPPAPLVTTAPNPAPRAEAEIVAFLALLQEKGRLVDFLREDLGAASDEQVGTAARVVHAGCRSVLNEYMEIVPVRTEGEGTKITLVSGYDSSVHRLLGSVPAHPPYVGKLLHPGWAVRSVALPRVTGTTAERPWPVLAPAEVEISKA